MKKFWIFFVIIILLGIGVSVFFMSKQNDAGQKGITTYEGYVAWLKQVQEKGKLSYSGETTAGNTEKEVEEFYENNREHFFKISQGNPSFIHGTFCAMLVEAGDEYIPYDGTFEQNVFIKKVFEGCSYEEETDISVIFNFGASSDSEGNVTLNTAYGQPPLIPGDTYLIFCEETELSADMNRPQFRVFAGANSYLNVNNNKVTVISSGVTVDEVLKSEFIVGEQYSESYLLKIKNEILKNYGLLDE
ncbi:MAG: hypothetical protein ACI39R_04925 [Lachnospiraceae bacterium]